MNVRADEVTDTMRLLTTSGPKKILYVIPTTMKPDRPAIRIRYDNPGGVDELVLPVAATVGVEDATSTEKEN